MPDYVVYAYVPNATPAQHRAMVINGLRSEEEILERLPPGVTNYAHAPNYPTVAAAIDHAIKSGYKGGQPHFIGTRNSVAASPGYSPAGA